MRLVGIDPGQSYAGVAVWAHGDLVELHRVRGGSPERACYAVADRVAAARPDRVGIERCPPTVGRSMGPRSGQAGIGWRLGEVAGAVRVAVRPVHVVELPVSSWRAALEVEAAARGVVVHRSGGAGSIRPGVRALERIAGELVATWHGCEHTTPMPLRLDQLADAKKAGCPACRGKHPQSATDEWKAWACEVVSRLWPALYAPVAAAARRAARSTGQPDWQLEGVPDACEAVGVVVALRRAP